jgi:hypothetical protein
MLPFSNMVHLLTHELSGLSARGLSLAPVPARPLHRLSGHMNLQ